jgi:ubiquinone biosynthesis monooxygenase Coq7
MPKNQHTKSTTIKGPSYLPGDPNPSEDLDRMLRVDHAGEYGAVRIYAGQLAVLRDQHAGKAIREMAEQEAQHLQRFNEILPARNVRPTLLAPVWHIAGYMLGMTTALLGERAAMACTVAIEEVIDQHYADQAARLGPEEDALKQTIEKFRAEELEHRDTALDHDAENAPGYPMLTSAIKFASRAAIWLSTRI